MNIKTFNIVLPLNIKKGWILFVILIGLGAPAYCQTLYVDAAKGRNGAKGTVDAPMASLEEAIKRTHDFKGDQPVTIRLNPGLYVIKDKLDIKTAGKTGNNQSYNIEAVIMPDAAGYEPYKMPVIQSVSGINDTSQFPHCEALLVEKNNVHIAGIKFVGNPNPEVHTYYPIRRADKTLKGLSVSQCYFIGERNSSAIQSAFWASGPGIHIDHCIFHSCKIVVVLSSDVSDFSLTYSIIKDAYNTAIWYGFAGSVPGFVVDHNIITGCYYVMVYPAEKGQPHFTFRNAVITGNTHYFGNYPKAQDKFFPETSISIKEVNIKHNGKVRLTDVMDDGLTGNYLQPVPGSAGWNLGAGIYKISRRL